MKTALLMVTLAAAVSFAACSKKEETTTTTTTPAPASTTTSSTPPPSIGDAADSAATSALVGRHVGDGRRFVGDGAASGHERRFGRASK